MCLFNFPNKSSIKAKEKGILEFECGSCPECLQKKSRLWALRCSMEAKVSPGVMVTLTYDTYKVIYGKTSTIEENPTDPTIPLSKRDCQLFMKRLRKHFAPQKIKYLITAERGKRTGRAHYHALIFGVVFNDLIKYKRSDRGNWIYKSKTLEKIWQKGICTVDCINLSAKTARYCTKYCSKDAGVDDTFMLFSRGIGEEKLFEEFDGKSYWIEGREYSIPKQIWQKVIEARYNCFGLSKYIPKVRLEDTEKKILNTILRDKDDAQERVRYYISMLRRSDEFHQFGLENNQRFQEIRDNDPQYQNYIRYWSDKAKVYERTRPTVEMRILALPNDKYRTYKTKCILAKYKQHKGRDFIPPRSKIQSFVKFHKRKEYEEKAFAPLSRHYRANDTIRARYEEEIKELRSLRMKHLLKKVEKLDPILNKEVFLWSFEKKWLILA